VSRLFDRTLALTIAKPTGFFTQDKRNAIVIRDLRVTFHVEKNLGEEPNTCNIVVYNLAEHSRSLLKVKPVHIRLEAGYDGQTQRLFDGDLRWANSRHVVEVWETKIQLGNGDRAFRYARAGRSFKAGIDAKSIVKELSSNLGLKMPGNVDQARELVGQFATGVTLHGPAEKEMTRILGAKGYGWSVQDSRLQILKGNEAQEGEAFLISEDAGMIGSPEFGPPPEKGGKPTLSVEMLLRPEITPGRLIKMESTIRGIFRVDRVTHTGDNRGDEFTTRIEARQSSEH
jgi:hypothetical protein